MTIKTITHRALAWSLAGGFCGSVCHAQAAPQKPQQSSTKSVAKSTDAYTQSLAPLWEQLKHDSWVTPAQIVTAHAAVDKIRTLHVGMTRADLLKILQEEGGISTPTRRQYVYSLGKDKTGRYGQYLKVEVEFVPRRDYPKWLNQRLILGSGWRSDKEMPDDVVTKMSPPFLGYMIID